MSATSLFRFIHTLAIPKIINELTNLNLLTYRKNDMARCSFDLEKPVCDSLNGNRSTQQAHIFVEGSESVYIYKCLSYKTFY